MVGHVINDGVKRHWKLLGETYIEVLEYDGHLLICFTLLLKR